MNTCGTLIGIATHAQSKSAIIEHSTINVSQASGLKGDFRGAQNRNTQVTILSLHAWQQACSQVNKHLHWTERRANLLVDEIHFKKEMLGSQIQIGDVLLQVTDETDPCSRMDELVPELKNALTPDWRGGVRCRVLQEGTISIGDKIEVLMA